MEQVHNKREDGNTVTSDAESVLSAVETFTIPDVSQIQKYIGLFNEVLQKRKIQEVFVRRIQLCWIIFRLS